MRPLHEFDACTDYHQTACPITDEPSSADGTDISTESSHDGQSLTGGGHFGVPPREPSVHVRSLVREVIDTLLEDSDSTNGEKGSGSWHRRKRAAYRSGLREVWKAAALRNATIRRGRVPGGNAKSQKMKSSSDNMANFLVALEHRRRGDVSMTGKDIDQLYQEYTGKLPALRDVWQYEWYPKDHFNSRDAIELLQLLASRWGEYFIHSPTTLKRRLWQGHVMTVRFQGTKAPPSARYPQAREYFDDRLAQYKLYKKDESKYYRMMVGRVAEEDRDEIPKMFRKYLKEAQTGLERFLR